MGFVSFFVVVVNVGFCNLIPFCSVLSVAYLLKVIIYVHNFLAAMLLHFSSCRAVAKYLQVLFDKEAQQSRKVIPMDNLLFGKTRKEASRMFFEALVCLFPSVSFETFISNGLSLVLCTLLSLTN